MHIERLRKLAQFLERLPAKRFDMGSFGYKKEGCGTVACIAGWTPSIAHVKRDPDNPARVILRHGASQPVSFFAQEWLGLSDYQADGLFYAQHGWGKGGWSSPRAAAKRIRRLIRTGS